MKCVSCNNEIPNISTTCPFCGNPCVPNVNAPVIPATPEAPILPKDQYLENKDVAPAVPIEVITNTQLITPVENVNVNQNSGVEVAPQNISEQNFVDLQDTMAIPTQNVEVNSQEVAPQVINTQVQQVVPQVVNSQTSQETNTQGENQVNNADSQIVPDYIDANGEVIDGSKIASSLTPEDKKKNKKKKLILIILLLLFIVIIGLGVYFYITEFRTADKRITTFFNKITTFSNTLGNDSVKSSSGDYSLKLFVKNGDDNISTSLNGSYAYSIDDKIIDYKMEIDELNSGENLINDPLNLEVYYNDSKLYFLLSNFYENYIYVDYPELNSIFDNANKGNINYSIIVNGLKSSLINALKSLPNEQKIGKVTIAGKEKQVNIVTININSNNQVTLKNALIRNILNNNTLMSELAKLANGGEETLKNSLNSVLENNDIKVDGNFKLSIYTSIISANFEGLDISLSSADENYLITIYPENTNYHFIVKQNNEKIIDGTYNKKTSRTSSKIDTTYYLTLTANMNESNYSFGVEFTNSKDVTANVEKVNVKNSVNLEYLSNDDKKNIYNNINNYGSLGSLITEYVKPILGEVEEELDPNSDEAKCKNISICVMSDTEGYLSCSIKDSNEKVLCSTDWLYN